MIYFLQLYWVIQKTLGQLPLFLVFQGCVWFARYMVKDVIQKCYYKARAVALLARVANQQLFLLGYFN